MEKTSDNQNVSSADAHRVVQKSTTLNRRYVKRPEPVVKKVTVTDESDVKAQKSRVIESISLEDAIEEAKNVEISTSPMISRFPVEAESKASAPVRSEPIKIEISDEVKSSEEEVAKAVKKIEEENVEVAEAAAPLAPVEIVVESETETPEEAPDLPPAENPYKEALDARAGALEVRKVASRAAEFYVGPTAEERKNAEIDKAIAELEESSQIKLSDHELKLREKAERRAKAEAARLEKQRKAVADRELAKQQAEEKRVAAMMAREEAKWAKKVAKKSGVVVEPVAKKVVEEKKAKAAKRESLLEKNVENGEMEKTMRRGRGKRVAFALACSFACVAALGVFVYNSVPDISVKVTAMQSGIDAIYPSYVPRDFSLSGVYMNDEDAIVMDFEGPEDSKFSITEIESSWDSMALLNNYVKKNWSESEYTAVRESGTTIYINNSKAVWVNGGMMFKIEAPNGTLTKKQIKNIVTSM